MKDFQSGIVLEDCLDDESQPVTTLNIEQIKDTGILAKYLPDQQLEESDDQIPIENYKSGGHAPIFIGEVVNSRYVVLQKLG